MSNCRAKMYPRRILSSFYTKTLHLRYKKPNLGGFSGCIVGSFDRFSTTWQCFLSTNNGQFSTSNKDLLYPVWRLHALFDHRLFLLNIAHNILNCLFQRYRIINVDFLCVKGGAILPAPYHTPVRKSLWIQKYGKMNTPFCFDAKQHESSAPYKTMKIEDLTSIDNRKYCLEREMSSSFLFVSHDTYSYPSIL